MAAFNTLLGALTVNTDSVFVLAGVVMTGIAAIWAIKKVVALGNKS